MKKLTLIALLIATLTTTIFAQKDETLFGRSGLRLSGAWGASTTNLTFFEDDFVAVSGGYGGLEFGKSVFVGWGGYRTTSDFNIGSDIQNRDLSFRYNGGMIGYAPRSHNAIHPKFNLLVGGGSLRVNGGNADAILVVEPSIGVELNVFQWFRFGLDGGYRFVTNTDQLVTDSAVSAPYGQMTFKFGLSWGRSKTKDQRKYDDLDN